jgi:hypothetical protein
MGDRGRFIPENLGAEQYVYEISDAKAVEGVERLTSRKTTTACIEICGFPHLAQRARVDIDGIRSKA